MADIPEVDTIKAFFLLVLGGVVASFVLYAYKQTLKNTIDTAINPAPSPMTGTALPASSQSNLAPAPGPINATSY